MTKIQETIEKESKELNIKEQELNKKIEELLESFDYYNNIVEKLRKMFIEYEIYDNIICFSTLENNSDILNINLDINYVIKILYNDNIFQFNAVDFKNNDTKFNVYIYNIKNNIIKYTSDNFENLKNDIIKWLLTI